MTDYERRCTVAGCSRPHRLRGFCQRHYAAARRAGLPTLEPMDDDGDYIAEMVLKLVRSIAELPSRAERPAREPVHPSPVYRQYEDYVASRAS